MTMFSKKMTKPLPWVLSALLGVAVLAGSGCTEEQKEQQEYRTMERKRAVAEKAVSDRAKLYWDLVRWQDWDRAARLFEQPESQLAFLKTVSSATTTHPTRENINIEFVFVSSDNLEQAELRIAWTEVVAIHGSVQPRVVSQEWYKSQGRWWARPELPFGREQGVIPGVGEDPEGIDESPPEDLPTEPAGPDEPAADAPE